MAMRNERGSGKGPRVLKQEDVWALFQLIALVLYDPKEDEDVAFSGSALASVFAEYGEHLMKLMSHWEDLPGALRSEDARQRARALNRRLRELASEGRLVDVRGRVLRTVGDPEAAHARSLIRGKGMEL